MDGELTTHIAQLRAGTSDPPALLRALCAAQLHCVRPERPGFLVLGPPGAQMLPVFTSPGELARWTREPSGWFAMPGADLLRALPPGCDIALDLAGPQPVRLHHALWAPVHAASDE